MILIICTILITCIKLLLIPSYRSTDFEVHRNWLAITHNLPRKKWYFEDTSEWTLDYPPLFAWFEYFLSLFAKYFDENMLDLKNLYYASQYTILFQRLTVIITDFVYVYGTYKCTLSLPKGWRTEIVLVLLLITNVGLLMVDHIHFQYNGFLYGILLLSIANMLEKNMLMAAFWFAILINLKHIYIYMAPTYFFYLLRNYCFDDNNKSTSNKWLDFSIINTTKLGLVVFAIFSATYLPFADNLGQVLSRLFPFKRGLCHAYWAPNFWAFYNTLDKTAAYLMVDERMASKASMTAGLVREYSHAVLPTVTPLITMAISAIAMLPICWKLSFSRGYSIECFLRSLALCSLTSFLFGWHVHEKAILMTIIPMTILSILNFEDAKVFFIITTVGNYSLMPLLFPKSLLTIKFLLVLIYTSYSYYTLRTIYPKRKLLNEIEILYLTGLILLFVYDNFMHNLLLPNLPFFPLMATSLYCSFGVMYCWFKLNVTLFTV